MLQEISLLCDCHEQWDEGSASEINLIKLATPMTVTISLEWQASSLIVISLKYIGQYKLSCNSNKPI